MNVRYVDASTIEAVSDVRGLADEIAAAYRAELRRAATTPPRMMIVKETPSFSIFGAMPSISQDVGLYVTKLATLRERHDAASDRRAPTIHALVAAFDTESGAPLAMLEGASLTNVKCAAVTALVTDRCARADASAMGLVGAGVLAFEQIRGVAAVRSIERVVVFGRNRSRTEAFAARARAIVAPGTRIEVATRIEDALTLPIVCTATTSTEPLVTSEHLVSDVHVNCMGSHTPASREVSHELLRESTVLVEDRALALEEAGPLHDRAIEFEAMLRLPDEQLRRTRTVFSSTGHAFLDLLATAHVLRRLGLHAHDTRNGATR